jgi:DNA-binding transcriptional regulator GbsR (MarR family)
LWHDSRVKINSLQDLKKVQKKLAEAHAQARMRDMLAPMELLTKWYDDVERLAHTCLQLT